LPPDVTIPGVCPSVRPSLRWSLTLYTHHANSRRHSPQNLGTKDTALLVLCPLEVRSQTTFSPNSSKAVIPCYSKGYLKGV